MMIVSDLFHQLLRAFLLAIFFGAVKPLGICQEIANWNHFDVVRTLSRVPTWALLDLFLLNAFKF